MSNNKSNPMQEQREAAAPNPETVIASALHAADAFISEELDTRRRSYEPNPTQEELADIAAAVDALALVRAASQQVTNL